jgi:L-2-hydroxyglutarate oxidase
LTYDIVIVGGGIVGLATALQIKRSSPGLRVIVLEKESRLAAHQTGHNSGVIHSGIYYKPGSLKAANCVRGYNLLVDFCRENDVPFELCGKIIVATDNAEVPYLETLLERGQKNGLQNLRRLKGEELREFEPHVTGVAGIHVPQTGIVDFTRVAEAYGRLLSTGGTEIHLDEQVIDAQQSAGQVVVSTQKQSYSAKLVINCAGLYSDKVARLTVKDVPVKIVPFRGEYFTIRKDRESLVRNLIYPVPDPNFPFLGVHFTRMAKGGVECGPNAVLAFAREGYRKTDINMAELAETLAWPGFRRVAGRYWRTGLGELYRSWSKAAFTRALRKLVPEIREEDLVEGGSGVRAQACDRQGGLVDDFLILEEKHAINVCNAPSPAATSSLAIGETVAKRAVGRF